MRDRKKIPRLWYPPLPLPQKILGFWWDSTSLTANRLAASRCGRKSTWSAACRRPHTNIHPPKSYLTLSDVQIADGLIFHTGVSNWRFCHESSYWLSQGCAMKGLRRRKRWKAQRQIPSADQLTQTVQGNKSIWLPPLRWCLFSQPSSRGHMVNRGKSWKLTAISNKQLLQWSTNTDAVCSCYYKTRGFAGVMHSGCGWWVWPISPVWTIRIASQERWF